jgi:hypothetical protein
MLHDIGWLSSEVPAGAETAEQWVARQYRSLDLPDKRLKNRCLRIAMDITENPHGSLNQAADDWGQAKAAYRFIENSRLTAEDLQTPVGDAAAKACARHRTILAVQDTTALKFDSARHADGLGTISDSSVTRGMFFHPVLALQPDGLAIGLLDQQWWCRETEVAHKAQKRNKRPILEKESCKWLKGAANASLALKSNLSPEKRPRVVHVFDREGDVHEAFELIATLRDDAVIRCAHNRRVIAPDGREGLAHDLIRRSPVLGTIAIAVPRKPGEPKRTADLQIRAMPLTLNPRLDIYPDRRPITLTLVEAFEAEPPEGAEPLHWLLWTTLCAVDFDQALEVIRIYTLRWKIEEFFYALKQGCRIEKVQFQSAERLAKVVVLYSAVAIRILICRDLARLRPDNPCTEMLAEVEWKALWTYIHKKPPAKIQEPPTMRQATLWIGRIGGHLNRKSDGMPGLKTLWRGLQSLTLLTRMFAIVEN